MAKHLEAHHDDDSHADSHMKDFAAHVTAVEEDLEYYRTKRLEPRLIRLLRKGVVTLPDLLKAHTSLQQRRKHTARGPKKRTTEERIRALEDSLDEYVKRIAVASSSIIEHADFVIEDDRKERGDYDDFFRIAKREHGGSMEERIKNLEEDLKNYHLVLDAVTEALIIRGLADRRELARRLRAMNKRKAWNGATIVARAWVDPKFRGSLLTRAREAVREMGIPPGRIGELKVVENTDSVHNVIVCTLCSCYPYDLLGDTPWWYKHDIYKTNIIKKPRQTIKDMFDLDIPVTREVRVHDSISDIRYMVLPRRPTGTEDWSEEELAKLVTVESLIGAGECLDPSDVSADGKSTKAAAPRVRPD